MRAAEPFKCVGDHPPFIQKQSDFIVLSFILITGSVTHSLFSQRLRAEDLSDL